MSEEEWFNLGGEGDWWLNPNIDEKVAEEKSASQNWWDQPDAFDVGGISDGWDMYARQPDAVEVKWDDSPARSRQPSPDALISQLANQRWERRQYLTNENLGLVTANYRFAMDNNWSVQNAGAQGMANLQGMLDAFLGDIDQMLQDFFVSVDQGDNVVYTVAIRGRSIDGELVEVFQQIPRDVNGARYLLLTALGNALQSAQSIQGALGFTFSARRIRSVVIGNYKDCATFFADVFPLSVVQASILAGECMLECILLDLIRTSHEWTPDVFIRIETCGRNLNAARVLYPRIRGICEEKMPNMDWKSVCMENIPEIERMLNKTIVVFTVNHGLRFLYSGNLTFRSAMFLYCSNADDTFHVDYAVAFEKCIGLDGYSRFCLVCQSRYKRSTKCKDAECHRKFIDGRSPSYVCLRCHTCAKMCASCLRPKTDCLLETCDDFLMKCDCGLKCLNANCFSLHVDQCEKGVLHEKCAHCGEDYHLGKCDMIACEGCGNVLLRRDIPYHVCCIVSKKLKAPNDKIAVYDFECYTKPCGEHVPYLITVWFPYANPLFANNVLKDVQKRLIPHEKNPVYVFWGACEIDTFIKCLKKHCCRGYTFIAHNGKSYDHILIQALLLKHEIQFEQTRRGRKILEMKCPKLKIMFRDSLCFIPSSLRDMPKNFGIEEIAKGHFPHKLMTEENMQKFERMGWIVPKPALEDYIDPFFTRWGKSGKKALQDVEEFYGERWKSETVWNIKNEAIQYCVSDTVLLGNVVRCFRESTKALTLQPDSTFLDPFAYMTLPSAIFAHFLANVIEPNSIGIVDRHAILSKRDAVECLLYYVDLEGYGTETQVRQWCVDLWKGCFYVNLMDHAFVYADCYDSGCLICFPGHEKHCRLRQPFSKLAFLFEQKVTNLRASFPEVHVVKSHEWHALKKDASVTKFLKSWKCLRNCPLDPREAYKGGKVEPYIFMAKEQSLDMDDVVSLYPAMMTGSHFNPNPNLEDEKVATYFPIGLPSERFDCAHSFPDWFNHEGIASVLILPPLDLYAPLLPFKVPSVIQQGVEETLYGLCRTCMEDRLFECDHTTDDARAIFGTFTFVEIREAIGCGYRVLEVADYWIYEKRSNTLFQKLLTPFIRSKICSKRDGLVDVHGKFTEQGKSVCKYLLALDGKTTVANDFQNLPAIRQVAKLAQNAFYGKLGQREQQISHGSYFAFQESEVMQLFINPDIEIRHVELLGNSQSKLLCSVVFTSLRAATKGHFRKSDILAAYVTAHARCYLNRRERECSMNPDGSCMDKPILGYVDTDSVARLSGSSPYKQGYRVGDMEPELDGLKNWICFGRKAYMYDKPDGERICKLKGVTLSQMHEEVFTAEKLRTMLLGMQEIITGNQITKAVRDSIPSLVVQQRLFSTDFDKELIRPVKRTRTMLKKTTLDVGKRIILWPDNEQGFSNLDVIRSVPYGFIKRNKNFANYVHCVYRLKKT